MAGVTNTLTRVGARRLTLAAAVALAGCSHSPPRAPASAPPAAAHAQIGVWGLDLTARDTAVRPGDDFYRYADGLWIDAHHIPPDRTRWGSFDELDERSQQQLHGIVEALPAHAPEGSHAQKDGY
ncbi:MAG TPA: hypothetical protein VGD47_08540, partial [Steroidobacteraceae bacterium]